MKIFNRTTTNKVGNTNMYISPVSYRSNPQNLQNYGNKAAQPAFEGRIGRGIATAVVAMAVSLGAHAQSAATTAAKVVPDSIPLRYLQFNPEDLKIMHLKQAPETITQESLTKDSLDLVKLIKTFNKRQSTPDGWAGKSYTPEQYVETFDSRYMAFVVRKVWKAVQDGTIPKPPEKEGVDIVMLLGKRSLVEDLAERNKLLIETFGH